MVKWMNAFWVIPLVLSRIVQSQMIPDVEEFGKFLFINKTNLYPETLVYDGNWGLLFSSMEYGSIFFLEGTAEENTYTVKELASRSDYPALLQTVGFRVLDNFLYVCSNPDELIDQWLSWDGSANTIPQDQGQLVIIDLTNESTVAVMELPDFVVEVDGSESVKRWHFCNDIAVSDDGTAYISDSFSGAVYRMSMESEPMASTTDIPDNIGSSTTESAMETTAHLIIRTTDQSPTHIATQPNIPTSPTDFDTTPGNTRRIGPGGRRRRLAYAYSNYVETYTLEVFGYNPDWHVDNGFGLNGIALNNYDQSYLVLSNYYAGTLYKFVLADAASDLADDKLYGGVQVDIQNALNLPVLDGLTFGSLIEDNLVYVVGAGAAAGYEFISEDNWMTANLTQTHTTKYGAVTAITHVEGKGAYLINCHLNSYFSGDTIHVFQVEKFLLSETHCSNNGGNGDDDDGDSDHSAKVAVIVLAILMALFLVCGVTSLALWQREKKAHHSFHDAHESAASTKYQQL